MAIHYHLVYLILSVPMFNHMAYSAIAWPNVPCIKLSIAYCLSLIVDMWYGTHAWG